MRACLLDARRLVPEPGEPSDDRILVPLFVERALDLAFGASSKEPLFLDQLIPTATFHALADRALLCRDRFLELARGGEALEGPEALDLFRGDELLFFFRELLFGQAVADALLAEGFERIDFRPGTSRDGSPTAEGFYRALAAAFECAGEDGRLRHLSASEGVTAARGLGVRRLGVRLGNAYRKLRNRLEPFYARPPVPGRCVAIFFSSQWQRFREALGDLRAHYGSELAFWTLGRLDPTVRRFAGEHGIPLSQIPLPPTLDTDVERCFERRHTAWLAEGRAKLAREMECPALAAPRLEGAFELYFRSTFPRAAQWLRSVGRHLEAAAPELVVGSAAFTHTSAMPLLAAGHLGIRSLALSHTYISGDHGPLPPGSLLACRNAFERRGYRRTVVDETRIVYCRNASDALSYAVEARPELAGGERKRVALLTASPQVQGEAMPLHELGAWVRSLRALAQPPSGLAEVEWVFKFHPRFDCSHHLEGEELPANVRVVPADSSVHELLATSWLAVLVEHVGGVGIDARRAGVPLLFLDAASYRFARVEPETLEAERLESPEALWQRVAELVADPGLYEELEARNDELCERWLRPAERNLGDVLRCGLPETAGEGFSP